MTTFQLPSAIFPENAITRAERAYQRRTAKKPRTWRRWLTRLALWLMITIALIEFGGLLIASLTQHDPTPLVDSLGPLPRLFSYATVFFHLFLMFQTMSLAAHSITREKEAQTWEMLVLTGIDAREIVRGKWWAIVQRQLPRYAVLAVLRMGLVVVMGIAISSIFFGLFSQNYTSQLRLAHPVSILFAALLGAGYTFANLGLSAACGVMASAASKRSTVAILRGFAIQFVLSVITSLASLWLISRFLDVLRVPGGSDTALAFGGMAFSFADNGILASISTISPTIASTYEQVAPSIIMPIAISWIAAGVIGIALYGLLILFVLRRAEKDAVRALATAFDKSSNVKSTE